MNPVAGDIVAIQGLGGLGHLALQYSRKMGYNTVAISSSDAKKEFATKLGANHYIDTSKEDAAEALQKMGGASLVVITAPNPKIMGNMVNACGPAGKVVILARELLILSPSCSAASASLMAMQMLVPRPLERAFA